MNKRWIWAGLGIAAVALLILLLASQKSADNSGVVDYEAVQGPFAVDIITTGELRAARSEDIMGPTALRQIGIFQVKLTDIIPEGSVVKEGDYVATLDRSEIANKLQELETALSLERSKLEQAKLDTSLDLSQARNQIINMGYEVEEKRFALEQSKYEPPAVVRQAEVDLDKAERALEDAKTNYSIKKRQAAGKVYEIIASLNLKQNQYDQMVAVVGQFTIHAPKPGMVVYARDWGGRKVAVGSNISAWNPVVATLPDLDRMISKTYVNEIDISRVKTGQKVDLGVDAFPGRKYTGVVQSVANVGQQKSNSNAKVFEVEILLNERDTTLRPSMTTSNTIHVARFDSVLIIPLECMHENDTADFVYLRKGKQTVRREVIRGPANDNFTIIEYGLEAGDRILYLAPDDATLLASEPVPAEVREQYLFKPEPIPDTPATEEASKEDILKSLEKQGIRVQPGGGPVGGNRQRQRP